MYLLFSIWLFFISLCQNIILINEESLILICFVFIILIFIKNVTYLANLTFKPYVQQKRYDINSVLIYLINSLKNTIYFSRIPFLHYIEQFTNYWIYFLKNFMYWNILSILYKVKFSYFLYFSLIQNLEYKVFKLMSVSLNTKLGKECLTKFFFKKIFISSKYRSMDLIYLRELLCLNKI